MRRLGFKAASVRRCLEAYTEMHGVGHLPKLLPKAEQEAIARACIDNYIRSKS